MIKKDKSIPDDLKSLATQFAAWRSKKVKRGEPIPAELLERAMKLTRRYSVCRVASVTGLDYTKFKSRLERASSKSPKPMVRREQAPALVKFAPIVLPMSNASRPNDAVIEIEGPNNLRLRLTGVDAEKMVRIYMEGCR